jgi:predicted CXXCH cytochrome family protein
VDPRERLNYRTVRENGCLTCHKIHSAPERERLLRFRREENNCLNCHNGTIAKTNILADIRKLSAHQVFLRTGLHDPTEDPFTMRRHVECFDCHNAHAARPQTPSQRSGTRGILLPPANLFVPGVTAGGVPVETSKFLHEICFRCHADSTIRRGTRIRRQVEQTNVRLELQTRNPSYHPIIGPRRNPDVVSLISPLRQGSMITCTDCHNSNNARFAGGNGPNGPHGSIHRPLLIANYDVRDFTVESAHAYALCYRCHDRNSILGNESFSRHRWHVVNQKAPCAACHDPHGIDAFQGNRRNHSNLINFNLAIVQPTDLPTSSRIEYQDTGSMQGNCTHTCHGETHLERAYSQ